MSGSGRQANDQRKHFVVEKQGGVKPLIDCWKGVDASKPFGNETWEGRGHVWWYVS